MSIIYGLTDPRTGIIRYVGATRQSPQRRLAEHIWAANEPTYRGAWIRSLIALSLAPRLVVLDRVSPEKLWEAEVQWISRLLATGYQLVNTAPGGEGRSGRLSAETRQRMSESRQGKPKSAAHRAAISAANKGKTKPPHPEGWGDAHAAKLRGHKHSEETRQKMAETRNRLYATNPELRAQVGKYERSDDHRAVMSEAVKRGKAAAKEIAAAPCG